MMHGLLLVLALFSAIPSADLACFPSGDEMEVSPLTAEAEAWMDASGFFPWEWVEGHRRRLPGRFSPGFRNETAWLTHAEEAGLVLGSECLGIAARHSRQN